jgi:hypothetical protein
LCLPRTVIVFGAFIETTLLVDGESAQQLAFALFQPINVAMEIIMKIEEIHIYPVGKQSILLRSVIARQRRHTFTRDIRTQEFRIIVRIIVYFIIIVHTNPYILINYKNI